MKQTLPQSIKTLLWDVNMDKLSLKDHYRYIIERVLEYGDIEEYKWMNKMFKKEQIRETLKESKRISYKTGNLYSRVYNINEGDMVCIQKPYIQRQSRF